MVQLPFWGTRDQPVAVATCSCLMAGMLPLTSVAVGTSFIKFFKYQRIVTAGDNSAQQSGLSLASTKYFVADSVLLCLH